MAPDPIIQGRVFVEIGSDLMSGFLWPGVRIDMSILAGRYCASMTPIREAMFRYVGSGHVELHSQGGFRVPRLEEKDLRQLYEWNAFVVAHALKGGELPVMGIGSSPRRDAPPAHPAVVTDLFERLGLLSPNGGFQNAIRNTSLRLAPARLVEPLVIKDYAGELLHLITDIGQSKKATIFARIRRYHKRRIDLAQSISMMISAMTPVR